MSILFSDHAKFQLRKRKISQTQVRRVIDNPNKILPSFSKRKLRQGRIGDKILEIVTITEGSKITVITGYYLEENL